MLSMASFLLCEVTRPRAGLGVGVSAEITRWRVCRTLGGTRGFRWRPSSRGVLGGAATFLDGGGAEVQLQDGEMVGIVPS